MFPIILKRAQIGNVQMLTNSQQKVWEFIQHFMLENNYAPTISEITEGLNLKARSPVHRAVRAIAEEGLIDLIPNKRRNIALKDLLSANDQQLPLMGSIAAGEPIEAIEEKEYIDVNGLFVGPGRYLLRVKGDSMIGDNICDGDYVVCESADTPRHGKIMVALVDHAEATLKRIYNNQDGTVTLMPSNPALEPMIYEASRVKVQGLFIGLFRIWQH
jgi:repressor LexA